MRNQKYEDISQKKMVLKLNGNITLKNTKKSSSLHDFFNINIQYPKVMLDINSTVQYGMNISPFEEMIRCKILKIYRQDKL